MMLGTRLCDRCWELEGRIRRDPELAKRILAQLSNDEAVREPVKASTQAQLTDQAAMDEICTRLSGAEWTADTADQIAAIVRATGRTIEDVA